MMKLLITADIHANPKWLKWISRQAPAYDLILIAGDFLDMNLKYCDSTQILAFIDWTKEFKQTDTLLALCSGNHDYADSPFCGDLHHPQLGKLYFFSHWLESVRDEQIIVSPETRLVTTRSGTKVVISSLHWYFYSNHGNPNIAALAQSYTGHNDPVHAKLAHEIQAQLKEGYALAQEHRCPWLWLHHEPPSMTPLVDKVYSNKPSYLNALIKTYNPTLVASGHYHETPLLPGGSYYYQLAQTHCFNAGYREEANTPCHITLEMNGNSIDHKHFH